MCGQRTLSLEARVTRCTGRACYGRSVGAQSGVEERAASHGETWVWGQTDVGTGRVRCPNPRKYSTVRVRCKAVVSDT